MPARVPAASFAAIAITVVLLFLGAGLLSLDGAPSAGAAFFDQGPRAVVSILGIPFLVWAMVLVGTDVLARNTTVIVRLLIAMGVTVVVSIVALVFWVAVAGAAGGFGALLVAIAISYLAMFCVSALISLALTHLLLFRRSAGAGAAVA